MNISGIISIVIFVIWGVYGINLVKRINLKYRKLEEMQDITHDIYSSKRRKITIELFKGIFGGLFIIFILFLIAVYFFGSEG